ncbi:salt stress protein, Slr1339 family [Scytonema sp. NUACC26]|uniref:salt stress protein, Slr1339 family n=1 Tax=Scytonema sp. NUACC26 TaxID=3140176 RepID=UPI0034DCB0D2
MDSIDKLLAELKEHYEQPKPEQSQPVPTRSVDVPISKSANPIDRLLEEVKAEFEQKDLALELQRQEQLEQERIRLLEIEAQKMEALKKQAQDWLDKLDPYSPEGLWFERFAETYPSKLEAAIEYYDSISG